MSGELREDIWAMGMKRTRQRVMVLDILQEADTPLTASEIDLRLQKIGQKLWLSTIYRVLDTFVEHGMLRKTDVLHNGMAVYELAGIHHRHYAVCMGCSKMIPLDCCPLEQVQPQLKEQDFQVLGHRLQMYGYCGKCIHTQEEK